MAPPRRFPFPGWLLRWLARLPHIHIWSPPTHPRPPALPTRRRADELSRPPRKIFLRGKVVQFR